MLQILITNNIRIKGASVPLRAAITKELTIPNMAYETRKKRRQPTYGVPRKLELFVMDQGDLVVPRGWKTSLLDILKQQGITPDKAITERTTEGTPVDFGTWNPAFEIGASPREYQLPAVAAAVKDDGVLIAPAGSGKTAMGMKYVHEKGVMAIWLTHTIDLLDQARAAAEKYMTGVGVIGQFGGGKQTWGDGKLIIATVQTLQANPQLIEQMNNMVGTVVIDEAHHFPATAFIEVAGQFQAKNVLGLTATPERKDHLQAYLYTGLGPVCHEIGRDGLYGTGALIKPEVKFVFTDFDYEQASDRTEWDSVDAGGDDMDYSALIAKLIADEKRAELVAETIIEAAPLGHALVITESVRYCFVLEAAVKRLAEKQNWALTTAVIHGGLSRYKWLQREPLEGVLETRTKDGRTEYKVEGYTEEEYEAWQVTPSERAGILVQAKAKTIDILFATQLAREGLDMPHLVVGHMAMPKRGDAQGSKNGAAVEQEIGRIMRPDPANPAKKAVWYDYVDYGVGVLQSQYSSRRSVYRRLDLPLPRKPKTEQETISDFLNTAGLFDLPI